MLKEHKRRWIELIAESGFDVEQFRFSETANGTFIIELIDSNMVFMIKQIPDHYDYFSTNNTEFRPSTPLRIPDESFQQQTARYEKDGVIAQIREWLANHVRRFLLELEQPDPLKDFNNYHSFFRSSTLYEEDDEPFNEPERIAIKAGLENLKVLIIANYGPSDDQLKQINEKLDKLSEDVEKLSRIQWKEKLLDTIINISVTLGLENWKKLMPLVQHAWEMLRQKLIHIPPLIS